MQQAEDSELIAGMKQRLRQLQDRRRQLLNSRRLEEEELAFREPITAQIADVMRSVIVLLLLCIYKQPVFSHHLNLPSIPTRNVSLTHIPHEDLINRRNVILFD
jgi:hypothetical protein